MTRIARRKLLTWCRRHGRHPGDRAGARLRPGRSERPLAALDRFRAGIRRAAQGPDRAGMQEGDSASPSRSRRSTPTTCSRASPRRSSPAPAPTSSWRSATGRSSTPRAWPTSSDVAEEIGKAQGGYYDVSKQVATVGNKWIGVPWTVGGGLIAYRKSWFAGGGLRQLPRDLGHVPRCRQEAEGQGPADRPDRRPHLRRRAGLVVSLPLVVGRQGGRGRRQDRRAEQQGNRRVDQVRGRPVEGDHGRRRAGLGRHQQQPRLPVADHQRHQQRRLDLHRSQEQARHLPDREGHADVRRTSCTPPSRRVPAASSTCPARSPTC